MNSRIRDIWFRCDLSLEDIAARIGMVNVLDDTEDYWAWVIGDLQAMRLDITRMHSKPRDQTDTRIFRLDNGEFSHERIVDLTGRLGTFVTGTITCGRWEYQSGNDFKLVVVRES